MLRLLYFLDEVCKYLDYLFWIFPKQFFENIENLHMAQISHLAQEWWMQFNIGCVLITKALVFDAKNL